MSQTNSRHRNKVSKFPIYFGLAWLVFATPFTLVGIADLKKENLYQSSGIKTEGKVLSKSYKQTRDSKNNVSNSYLVKYIYRNERDLDITSEHSAPEELWNALEDGASVTIQFLPGNSGESRIYYADRNDYIFGYAFIGIGLVMALIGIASISLFIKSLMQTKHLLTQGVLTEGTIITSFPGTLSINGVDQWRIRYGYSDHRGKRHEGITPHMPPAVANFRKPGEKIQVRYDKNKPHISLLVE